MDKRIVYADNAATTAVSQKVIDAMLPYFKEHYGNPSSVYSLGRESKQAIDLAREQVAKALGATPGEIYFTSCATESNNWALRGAMHALKKKGKTHLITTMFEHHAILHTAEDLEKEGFEVTYLPVDEFGIVSSEDLKKALRPETGLVSIMYANNEIGTIQDIETLGNICHKAGVLFHTDAVQAVGNLEIDLSVLPVDLLSLSAHKFHGPKGVGALYIKKGVVIDRFLTGGGQEKGRRGGTENLAYIVGLGVAIEEATKNIKDKQIYLKKMRDRVIEEMLKLPKVKLNGHPQKRLAGNVNLSFEGVEGEGLLLMLDAKGICASSGSACTSGSLDPSHVLMSIGLEHMVAHGSLRLSFSTDNTMEDIDYIVGEIPKVITLLRSMSPVWKEQ